MNELDEKFQVEIVNAGIRRLEAVSEIYNKKSHHLEGGYELYNLLGDMVCVVHTNAQCAKAVAETHAPGPEVVDAVTKHIEYAKRNCDSALEIYRELGKRLDMLRRSVDSARETWENSKSFAATETDAPRART